MFKRGLGYKTKGVAVRCLGSGVRGLGFSCSRVQRVVDLRLRRCVHFVRCGLYGRQRYLQAKCYNCCMWEVRDALHESVTLFVCGKCVKRYLRLDDFGIHVDAEGGGGEG